MLDIATYVCGATVMVWRKILQQESEHQWLAISGFFIFVILGAVLIKGTSHLPGVDLTENEFGAEHRVMEIAYSDEMSAVASTYSDGNYQLIAIESGSINVIMDKDSQFDVSRISQITTIENSSVLVTNGLDEVILIENLQTFEFETNFGVDDFGVTDIAQSKNDPHRFLMITKETDSFNSIRGLNSTGITSSFTPNNENVIWDNLAHVSNQQWIATGTYNAPATSGGESPAAPSLKPVWAKVLWNGGYTAPMIDDLHIGEYGEYHTAVNLNNEQFVIAGTHETIILDHQTGDFETMDYSSVAAASDKCDSVWLFNGQDSSSVLRFSGDSWSVENLPHDIPINVEAAGFDGTIVHLHGIDENGSPKVLTFDTSALGSIESGGGFINLSFIVISLIMFAVMAINIYDKFRQ